MKRSEREQQVLSALEDFWRMPWIDRPTDREVRAALAKALVDAEIANGAKFDPEEKPLPERLEMAGRRVIFDPKAPPHQQTATDNQIATSIVYGGASLHPASVFNELVLREAVRRYNAWPELRKLLDTLGRHGHAEHATALRRILDGKETP